MAFIINISEKFESTIYIYRVNRIFFDLNKKSRLSNKKTLYIEIINLYRDYNVTLVFI